MNCYVLDTETTAMPYENGSIVEIAIIEAKNWEIHDKLHFGIRPTTKMSPGAQAVNGIKDSDLVNCPWFKDVEPEISSWLEDAESRKLPIITFNGDRFDREMLKLEYARLNKDHPEIKWPEIIWIDVYKLVCKLITLPVIEEATGTRSRNQANVAKFLGVEINNAHRALGDVETLLAIYKKLHERYDIDAILTGKFVKKPVKDKASAKAKTFIKTKSAVAKQVKHEFLVLNQETLDKQKDTALEKLAQLKVDEVAIKAISTVSILSKRIASILQKYNNIDVIDKISNEKSAKALILLSKYKKDSITIRQNSIHDLKTVVSSIEEMFRDWVIKPLDRAIEVITINRTAYITKDYENRNIDSAKALAELTKKAELATQKVFDEVKEKEGVDAALAKSTAVYDDIMSEALLLGVSRSSEIKIDGSKVSDKILFDIEVVDKATIPSKWLIPDLLEINKFVDKTNGEIAIPGILITPKVKTSIRQ